MVQLPKHAKYAQILKNSVAFKETANKRIFWSRRLLAWSKESMKWQARSNEAQAARLRREAEELQDKARLQDLTVREEPSGQADQEGREEGIPLVERFERNIESYKSGHYNETQVRREFVDPLFKALGWDIGGGEMMGSEVKQRTPLQAAGHVRAVCSQPKSNNFIWV